MSEVTQLLALARRQRLISGNMEAISTKACNALCEAQDLEKELAYREQHDGEHLMLAQSREALVRALANRKHYAKQLMIQLNEEGRKYAELVENYYETGLVAEPQTIDA